MKSGGRFQFTPLHGLKQGPTQRGVSPCRSVVFDEIQFWSGNVSACKNRPENFIKGECFFENFLKNDATAHWAEIKLAYTKKISSN